MIKKFNYFIYENYSINEEHSYEHYEVDVNSPIDYPKNKDRRIPLKEEDKILLKEYENKLFNYNKSKNVIAFYKNKKIKLNFNVTAHFIKKFLRKEYESKYTTQIIVNPDLYCGIDLLINNKNKILSYILTHSDCIGERIIVESLKENYSLIISINNKIDHYSITLISQMCGKYKLMNDKKIKLHTDSLDKIIERYIYI